MCHTWNYALLVFICLLLLQQVAANTQDDVARLYLNSPGEWPLYKRGKGLYEYVLNNRALQRGMHVPAPERLRVALDKLKRGGNITISLVGGSITAGQGAVDGFSYPNYLRNWFQDHYPGQVTLANGAVGGVMSTYMVVCMNVHVPKHADIVFVEFNQNDLSYGVSITSNGRRAFERLIRKLLALPNQPAVILMNSFSYTWPMSQGIYWHASDKDYSEFALFYGLTTLSIKGAVFHLLKANVTGFNTVPRQVDPAKYERVSFNWDPVHPDGQTGARCMFELALKLINDTMKSLETRPLNDDDIEAASAPLPPPMIPDNYPSVSDRCFIGNQFTTIVTRKDGFEWKNDAKNGPLQKFGMISTTPGAVLELTFDSRSTSTPQLRVHDGVIEKHGKPKESDAKFDDLVLVEVAHLESYEGMGKAHVTCVSGCECEGSVFNGHVAAHHSQLTMHGVYVSQSPACVIRITVLNDTSSGGHKARISGLMLSEEAGKHKPLSAVFKGVVEYVHHIAVESKDTLYDVKNHIRRLQEDGTELLLAEDTSGAKGSVRARWQLQRHWF